MRARVAEARVGRCEATGLRSPVCRRPSPDNRSLLTCELVHVLPSHVLCPHVRCNVACQGHALDLAGKAPRRPAAPLAGANHTAAELTKLLGGSAGGRAVRFCAVCDAPGHPVAQVSALPLLEAPPAV